MAEQTRKASDMVEIVSVFKSVHILAHRCIENIFFKAETSFRSVFWLSDPLNKLHVLKIFKGDDGVNRKIKECIVEKTDRLLLDKTSVGKQMQEKKEAMRCL